MTEVFRRLAVAGSAARRLVLAIPGARRYLRPLRYGWLVEALAAAGFLAVTLALVARTGLLDVDLAVRDWCEGIRAWHGTWWTVGFVLNHVGQGSVLTGGSFALAAYCAYRRRDLRPLLVPAAGFVLTYFGAGPLKMLTDRAGPREDKIPHPEWLFHYPGGMEYPSGHVVNAIVWYGVIVILLDLVLLRGGLNRRIRQAMLVLPGILVVGTTTYLSFHWLTDGVAGLLLGTVLLRLLWRVDWTSVLVPEQSSRTVASTVR